MNDLFEPTPASGEKFILTPDGPHYGKTVDAATGRFIRWEPKPETMERKKRNADRIPAMLAGKLTAWERNFLGGLNARKLSPKQQTIVDRIWEEKFK